MIRIRLRQPIIGWFIFLIALAVSAEERPNIVLIIADDMAWDDCGVYGHPTIKTPNIDRLAREGMKFSQAFLTISSCSPSRCSLITGRYPHNTDADELHWPLPGDQTTFVERLRENGYWVGAAGKWHLGDAIRDRFDAVLESDISGFQLPTGKNAPTKFVEKAEGDARSGCTQWTTLLRQKPNDKPFFLWLAAIDPHRPFDKEVTEGDYKHSDVRLPPYHPDAAEVREDYVQYYSEITRMDRYVGEVLSELKDLGEEDNTLILFISDNGRAFPRDKTTLYDSGIRTPWIVRWPAKVKAGSETSRLVSSVDIAPTFLELAGVSIPDTVEGKSFTPLLSNPKAAIRQHVFAEKNWHDYEDYSRCVRDERYKLIRNFYHDLPLTPPADAVRSPTFQIMKQQYEAGKLAKNCQRVFLAPRPEFELYDTVDDPFEMSNLSGNAEHTAVEARLRGALSAWRKETGDTLPKFRTADEFHRVTGKPTPARRRPRWSKKKMIAEGLTAE